MGAFGEKVKVIVEGKLSGLLTATTWRKALQAGRDQSLKEMIDRTVAGYGADGRKLKKTEHSTRLTKEANQSYYPSRYSGEYAAEGPDVVGRDTGQTLRDAKAKETVGSIDAKRASGSIEFSFATKRSQDVAQYLADSGRNIVGLSPGNTARGRAERKRITAAIMSELSSGANLKMRIT